MANLNDSLQKLHKAVDTTREAVAQINADTTPGDGLNALAERIKAAPSIGGNAKGIVTASSSVYKADLVGVYQEPKRLGEPLRVALDNATLLAAESVNGTVIILFAQDDNTYIKAAKWTGTEWHLGATELFLEGPLTQAVIATHFPASKYAGEVAILYREEEMGCIQFWEAGGTDYLTLTHRGTDIWSADSPYNVCAAWTMHPIMGETLSDLEETDRLTIISQDAQGQTVVTGITPTVREDTAGKEYLTATIAATVVIEPGDYPERKMDMGTLEAFTVPEPDKEEYQSRAWTISNHWKSGSILVSFPGADGERYLLELYDYTNTKSGSEAENTYMLASCHRMILGGYMPTAAAVAGVEGSVRLTGIFGGVSRTSGPNQKSALGAEIWTGEMGFVGEKPIPVFGEESTTYATNIGLVSACMVGNINSKLTALGYAAEDKYRCLLWQDKGGGPAVEVTEVGVAAQLVTSQDRMALVYQRGDSIYLQQLGTAQVVATVTDSGAADGMATTGGRPGQEIQYQSWREET